MIRCCSSSSVGRVGSIVVVGGWVVGLLLAID